MKKWLWLVGVLLMALTVAGAGVEASFFAGRPQTLPGSGKWELTAASGRVLYRGESGGRIEVTLPELEPGASVSAILRTAGGERRVRFYSPALLTGVVIRNLTARDWKVYGAVEGESAEILFGETLEQATAPLNLIFPSKFDFPLALGSDWRSVELRFAEISGRLGVLWSKREQHAELDGTANCLVLRRAGRTVVVFSPEFDPERVENLLLVQQLIKEKVQ